MRVGIFDSGLGGLLVTRGIVRVLPQHDLVYLGDTARVPYGNRSPEIVYDFLRDAVKFLFAKNCGLVVVACNTASAEALRRVQREFLPKNFPRHRVLGVIIPTAEIIAEKNARRVGVLATSGTVASGAWLREIKKLSPQIKVWQQAAPLLVPIIENDATKFARPILESYLRPLLAHKIDTLILGCTHYPIIKKMVREIIGAKIKIISQDEIIPQKLVNYLQRHPEINKHLTRRGQQQFLLTDITPATRQLATRWFGKNIKLELTKF